MKSIQRALIFKLGFWAFALALLTGVGFYLYMRSALLTEFDHSLAAKARTVATQVKREGDGRLEFEFSKKAMPEFHRSYRPEYFELWLPEGAPIASSKSLNGGHIENSPEPFPTECLWNLTLRDGRAGRAIRMWVRIPEEPPDAEDFKGLPGTHVPRGASVVVALAASRSELDAQLGTLLWSLLLVSAMLSLGAILCLNWTIRRVLRPLHEVGEQATRIDATSLDHRFAVHTMPRELQPICNRLNDLLGRIESAFGRQKRFASNVAHELRTPIAELRSLAEVSIKWPDDAEQSSQRFHDALDIARQMQTIVDALLALARCEDGRQMLALGPVNLREVISDVWAARQARGLPSGIDAQLDEIPDTIINTDKSLFTSILTNLISNAFDYTPTGGFVICSANQHEDKVTLNISNSNNQLQSADLPQLFEPFWRKNPARNDPAHSGLGLALVAAYARLLQIELGVALDDAGWFQVRLAIPAQSTPSNTKSSEQSAIHEPDPKIIC
jgi:two-component system sensor histidine kinase QseC